MTENDPSNGSENLSGAMWRGIDFSGLTVVLGAGTGRLIELLAAQAAISSGNLVVVSQRMEALSALAGLRQQGSLTLIQARPRVVPVMDETVDLLVFSGSLREVPDNRLEAMFGELWRVIVPGGQLRISDIIEPSEAEYNKAWSERNRIVRKLGLALGRPTALAVDLRRAAMAARSMGFDDLAVSVLPGFALTEAWLEETTAAIRMMAGHVVDRDLRNEILSDDLARLVAVYRLGEQRAAERFVLRGAKVGNLALDMEASFTEEDLMEDD
jgi:SAM-dependent methyltransferase